MSKAQRKDREAKQALFANILIAYEEAKQYGVRTHSKARLMGIRKKLLGY